MALLMAIKVWTANSLVMCQSHCPGEFITTEIWQEIATGCCAIFSCLTAVANCLPELSKLLLRSPTLGQYGCKGFISSNSAAPSVQCCHILLWCCITIAWYCYIVARVFSGNRDTTSVQLWYKFGKTSGKLLYWYWGQVVRMLPMAAITCPIVSKTFPEVATDLLWKSHMLVQCTDIVLMGWSWWLSG